MKHHEAIAVAKDLKERIKTHLDKGEVLLKLQPGLEQYKEVIQFNAVADDILTTYGGKKVTVSNEDFSENSVQVRVVSMESLLGDIARFIRGRNKKPKTPEVAREYKAYETMVQKFQWLATTSTELIDKYEPKQGTVKLGSSIGAYFSGDPKTLFKDFKADADVYLAVRRSVETGIKPAITHMREFTKGLDRFIGDADREAEFIKYIKPFITKEPKPFAETFRPPNHHFLAIGKVDDWFTTRQGTPDGFTHDRKEAKLPYPSKEQLVDLHGIAVRLASISMGVESITYEIPLGLDFTDPPFRGYSDNTEVQELVSKSTFFEPVFDEEHTNVVYNLDVAVASVASALVDYLRKVLS